MQLQMIICDKILKHTCISQIIETVDCSHSQVYFKILHKDHTKNLKVALFTRVQMAFNSPTSNTFEKCS